MKKSFLSPGQVKKIVEEYGSPVHVYDEKGIVKNAGKLNEAFSWNAGFKEYFAVKANPNPEIMKILAKENCGMDASSLTELMLCERAGITGDQIMFSSNVTPEEDYQLAVRLGATINLDDISHIEFLDSIVGIPDRISCRYNPGGAFSFSNQIMNSPEDAKYGFTYEQLAEGFRLLKNKGVKEFGLHSFLVSNTLDGKYYSELAKLMFRTAVRLKNDTGIKVSFINLSGGIGIPYLPVEKPVDIAGIGRAVKSVYNSILVPAGLNDVSLFTELGRYMTGPYGLILSRVLHEKKIYKNYIGLDACAVDLIRPAIYKAYHHITVSGKEHLPEDKTYDVTGGLCENIDKFAIDRTLPEVEIGDILIIHDTGAHGHAMGYNYNGKLKSAEVLLCKDGSTRMIRRAQTPEDYFTTLTF